MSGLRMDIDLVLRSQPVTVDVHLVDADRSVGLPSPYGEDEVVKDSTGKRLDWELTDDEWLLVNQRIADSVADGYFEDELYD